CTRSASATRRSPRRRDARRGLWIASFSAGAGDSGHDGRGGPAAALCAATGYPEKVRELIAHATFPGHQDGQTLSESELTQLAEAVKVLVQAGLGAEEIPVLIAECRARDGASWRDEFWRQ